MTTTRLNAYVRRYTSLSNVLDTLNNENLVLLSPSNWDDTNDIYYMDLYTAKAQVGSVLALCCTMASETYHHWKVFTQGMEGVCIEFKRLPLAAALERNPDVRAGPVKYVKVQDLEEFGPEDMERLPFLKRVGYSDEREWRIIASCGEKARQTLNIPIELAWINRLIFNPWMPPPLADNLRKIIRGLPGCSQLKIQSSKLTNSERWKAAGKNIAQYAS